MKNIHKETVKDFGLEWKQFDQKNVCPTELASIFESYFKIFPKKILNQSSVGIDIGSGSGRWAKFIAPKVQKLYCLDASNEALTVAKQNLSLENNIEFINASVNDIPIPDGSLDFAYSLGVLHHLPDPEAGIHAAAKKLKPGAPFLVYLYYAFDNKPVWFWFIWKLSDWIRQFISKLPFGLKLFLTNLISAIIYFPLAKTASFFEFLKFDVSNFPLSAYKNKSFYTMRTDALDRFSTRLEHRFTKNQIITMLEKAGLQNIIVNNTVPYWCAVGYKCIN